ncbi:MAG: hypothetical protein G01um101466_282 [Parcubacteria group bacterium Gr01-1014_66]|nr:MAG: hypothetical protein G01um101466_282 [Parcubacteria group bacterium Gr01-1014_66]
MAAFLFVPNRYTIQDMKYRKYIATVAEKGAGKGLFVEILKKLASDKKVEMIRSSDPWRDILCILGKEESRDNLSKTATALRAAFRDDGILIPALRNRLRATDADIVILDGLRKPEELGLARELNGIIVYIAGHPKIRFERRRVHAETTDEKGMTWEQFERQEQAETEISIRTIGETMADARIENNGTREEFEAAIKEFIEEYGLG